MPPKVKIPKEEIIRAAFGLTRESGIEAVTAKAVAKRLNCSIQPIYWVFDNMDNLRSAVTEEANREYNRYLLTEIPGVVKYHAIGINYLRFAREEPYLFKLLFMTDRQKNTGIAESDIDDNKDYILSLIEEGYGLTGETANRVYVEMWVFTHGLAAMSVTKTVKLDDKEVRDMMRDVLKGLVKGIRETEGKK